MKKNYFDIIKEYEQKIEDNSKGVYLLKSIFLSVLLISSIIITLTYLILKQE